MAIGEICSRVVVFARKDMTVRAAAQLMREHHVGALVVVDEPAQGRCIPVGILTDRDLAVGIVAKGLDADLLRVDEVMSADVLTAHQTDGVSQTIERMRAKGVRRIPVVDAGGVLVGIVTADDFVDLLAEEMTALARMMAREQRREAEIRKV
jgi:CBS domain-containing protein